MAKVGSKNTVPELAVRSALHARGYRFRLHRKDLPGKPDIVLPGRRIAVFVHGCFWHGCTRCDRGLRQPKSNADFWSVKLAGNRERDIRNADALEALGWKVITLWECDIRDASSLNATLDGSLPAVRFSY